MVGVRGGGGDLPGDGPVALREGNEFDGKGHGAGAQNVHHPVVHELDPEAQLLEDACVATGRQLGRLLAGKGKRRRQLSTWLRALTN